MIVRRNYRRIHDLIKFESSALVDYVYEYKTTIEKHDVYDRFKSAV